MKIAIDLNDVLRRFTAQFAKYYKIGVDRTFDIETVDVWTNDLRNIFPFETERDFLEFIYETYPFEIFAMAEATDKNLNSKFNDWLNNINNLDKEDIPEFLIISTKEYNKTIGTTYFFLSKLAVPIPTTKLFYNTEKVWDTCDVLITANPDLLNIKPEGKKSIKINTSYNEENEADFSYDSFIDMIEDKEFLIKIK